jgi:hypothetical protein
MFERPRDKNGEMCRKHGNTLIRTLRVRGSLAIARRDLLLTTFERSRLRPSPILIAPSTPAGRCRRTRRRRAQERN